MVTRRRYLPIDEMLSDWVFRILRVMRRFDWARPDDLCVALDIPTCGVDRQHRNNFTVVLSRIARKGLLERVGGPMTYQYRITDRGRAEYERQLQRSVA